MASSVINGVPTNQSRAPQFTSRSTAIPRTDFGGTTPSWEWLKEHSYGPSAWAWQRYLFRPLLGLNALQYFLIPSPLASPMEDQVFEYDNAADIDWAPAQLFGSQVFVPREFLYMPNFQSDFSRGNVSRMQAPNLYLTAPSIDQNVNGVPNTMAPVVPQLVPNDLLDALSWQVSNLSQITNQLRREIKQGFNHMDWTLSTIQAPPPVFNQTSPTVWTQNTYGAVATQYVYSIHIADVVYNNKTYYGRWYHWINPADAWIYQLQADQYVSNMNAQMQSDYNSAVESYNSELETYEETVLTVKQNNAKMAMSVAYDPVSTGNNARRSGRKQPDRNRKGRDRKMKQFGQYRLALKIINNTVGRGMEALEVWDAFFSNLEAKPMRARSDVPTDFEYQLALAQQYNNRNNLFEQGVKMYKVLEWYQAGLLDLNVEGFLKDIIWNRTQDAIIGRMSQSINKNINQDTRYGRPVGVQFGPAS